MTANGWIQIAIYAVLVTICVKPLGAYMARVFSNERIFLSPVLGPGGEKYGTSLAPSPDPATSEWTLPETGSVLHPQASTTSIASHRIADRRRVTGRLRPRMRVPRPERRARRPVERAGAGCASTGRRRAEGP